jgi:hypothetical protein
VSISRLVLIGDAGDKCGFADTTYLGMMISCIISNFNRWYRSSRGVGLEPPPFGPVISDVVVIYITQQQAVLSPVYDQAYVTACSNRPEPVILAASRPFQRGAS